MPALHCASCRATAVGAGSGAEGQHVCVFRPLWVMWPVQAPRRSVPQCHSLTGKWGGAWEDRTTAVHRETEKEEGLQSHRGGKEGKTGLPSPH